MKIVLVIVALVLAVFLPGWVIAQSFQLPITVSDGLYSQVLTVGFDPGATDAYNAGLDRFAPPPPVSNEVFDARLTTTAEDYYTDLRSSIFISDLIFDLIYQPSLLHGPLTLSWDNSSFPDSLTFTLVDAITGSLFQLNMRDANSLDISTNPNITNAVQLVMGHGEPDLSVIPTSFTVSANEGTSTFATLTLRNIGTASLALTLSDDVIWISADTSAATLIPGDSLLITLTFDATTLTPGTYITTLAVTSNDPDIAVLAIPVTFTVLLVPHITVLVPNGGESWTQGTIQTITWTDNFSTNVRIQLLRGTTVVQTISNNTPNDGNHAWTIPTTIAEASDYKVRVSSLTTPTIRDDSNANFTINAAPSIMVTVPNGGEVWTMGSTQEITWTDNITESISIRLLKGNTIVLLISSSTESDGSFAWTIPITLTTDSDYRIRIQSTTISTIRDESNANFTLNPAPFVTVIGPNGGEVWTIGSTQTITWTDNITENVAIRLLKGGIPAMTISTSTESDGSFAWTIPNLTVGNDYSVRIQSTTIPTLRDDSNANFTINALASDLDQLVTAAEDAEIPTDYTLLQNYPNPFVTYTTIRYALPDAQPVRLVLFDMLGREVRYLMAAKQTAGWHTLRVDATDLPVGLYLYRLEAGTYQKTLLMARTR